MRLNVQARPTPINLPKHFVLQKPVSNFQGLEYTVQLSRCFDLSIERRRRDLNPRAAINDLLPFQGSPFSQLGYFSMCLNHNFLFFFARRGWDSNPRALADKRFSRPPRYDHFDTSPKVCLNILLHQKGLVNRKPLLFLILFKSI